MTDTEHTHVTKDGFVVKCYHHCKSILLSIPFWIGITISYPIEHWIWTKLPPFSWISEFFGLIAH